MLATASEDPSADDGSVDRVADDGSVDRVVARVRELGLTPPALPPEYSYSSLPLCVVDAVFSIGVRYDTVKATIGRFCQNIGWEIFAKDRSSRIIGEHSIGDFVDLVDSMTSEQAAEQLFGNRQRTSSRNGILKAEATRRFAVALSKAGIQDFKDLSKDPLANAEALVRAIPGQKSGLSFGYFKMLAGDDELVKPDRMVQRFVAAAIGAKAVGADEAGLLVRLACKRIALTEPDWTPINLDHAIWLYQRTPVEGRGARP